MTLCNNSWLNPDTMETLQERYKRLLKEAEKKYAAYLSAHRKAAKNKADAALQQLEAMKKQEWLDAVQAQRGLP